MTSNEIITSVLLKSGFPTENYFTNAEMLSIMNDEMKLTINPFLMKLQEEFLLHYKDYTISSGATYRLPKRALGNKLRDVKLVNSGAFTDLNRLFEEDRSSNETGYYLSRNSLELSSSLTSGTLRLSYFLAPSKLVLTSSCAQVASIDSATQITVTSLPSTITTSTQVDIVQASGQVDLLAVDETISTIAGTTLTFASLPSDLAVGDYVCLAGEAPVPVIPQDLHPFLVQAVLCSCLSSKKDKSVGLELDKLKMIKETLSEMLEPRVESGDIFIRGQGLLSAIRNR